MHKYTLSFDEKQMLVLNAALVELPYRVAAALIQDINRQIAESTERVTMQKIVEDGK